MKIEKEIVDWYLSVKRDLPFRKTRDPYCIWVSEIMAQQTRIDTMVPYYLRWIEKWPTVTDLAEAKIEEVLKMWQGLGYYNRARKLHEGAQVIVSKYNGIIPSEFKELQKIPGIGFYTAGAISSIAFSKKFPAVDGNVLRVVSRLIELDEDITKKKTIEWVFEWVQNQMNITDPSDFTQAMMELGAMVCTPLSPSCESCPLNKKCQGYRNNTRMSYPHKTKTKKAQEIQYDVYLVVENGKILLSKDWNDGLMIDYLRLPMVERNVETPFKQIELIEKRKHVFSHRIWEMNCYKASIDEIKCDFWFWLPIEQLKEVSIVTAHNKWLKKEKLL